MSKITGLLAGACFASIAVLLPATTQAQEFTYDLVLKAKLENGRQIDMPGFPVTDFPECIYRKNRVQIGGKFPRGIIVMADGTSPSGTIIGARCVQRHPKMGE